MPDDNAVDEVVLTEEQKKAAAEAKAADEAAEAEFDAGFNPAPSTEIVPPVVEDEAAKATAAAEKEVADKAAAAATAAAALAAAAPKHRQVTEAEWTELKAKAAEVDQIRTDHRKEFDKVFGKIGGMDRTLATIQAATPAGYAVEVTDEVVADLAKEFPELGGLALKAFKAFASKLKGTAPVATAAAAPDPAVIEATVQTRLVALQSEDLEDARPEWRTITGAPDSKTAYRAWLATQPLEYQAKLASTNSAAVIARSIDKFEAHTVAASKEATAAAEKAAAEAKAKAAGDKRRSVLSAAVSPKGSAAHAAPAGGEDDFEEGFKQG